MIGNSFGKIVRLTTFGESHGAAIGGVLDGFPAGVPIDSEAVQYQLDRRKPGQSEIVTQRKESDKVQFLSGIFQGASTGTPIGFIIPNADHKSKDYDHLKDVFRPSHADFTYQQKYGLRDYRGGGRSSARETACRVVAGALAQQALAINNISIHAYVSAVGTLELEQPYTQLDLSQIDNTIVRCPDQNMATKMIAYIKQIKKEGDTLGGVIDCVVRNMPIGLGMPVFNKLHSDLAASIMSINAVKGFEFGSGFKGARMKGSEHNDPFISSVSGIETKSNLSGGIQGGISNGEDIYFKTAFKPVATLMQDQETVNTAGQPVTYKGKGRHDPCVVPRAVPIVDAMTALTILDHLLLNQTTRING